MPPQEAGKTTAILAYIGPLGLLIAFVLNQNEKAPLAGYHIRQSVGLQIVWLAVFTIGLVLTFIPAVRQLSFLLFPLIEIAVSVLLVMGLTTAANGETKPVSLLGTKIQVWLAGIA